MFRTTEVECPIISYCGEPIAGPGCVQQVLELILGPAGFHTMFSFTVELPTFNETMQENLVSIVEIKTRQHALDMNATLYGVQKCFSDFVPKFYEQLLVDAYTPPCGFMKVVNASVADLVKDNWRKNQTVFPKKWSPLVKLLKENAKNPHKQPLFLMLFTSNITSVLNVTV